MDAEAEAEAEAAGAQVVVDGPSRPEMNEGMKRRARMTRKFTQLRESLHVHTGDTVVTADDTRQQQTEGAVDEEERDEVEGRVEQLATGVPNWVDAFAHCLTGGIAGVVANALIFPIDVAKTRMQVEMPIFPVGLTGWALLGSFYQGLVLGSLETGAVHASSFLFQDYLKGRWVRERLGRGLVPGEEAPKVPIGTHLVLGMIASLGTQHVTLPLKVLLIRIQGAGAKIGLLEAARAVVAESGMLGFWAGSRATLWMATNPSVTYVVYERLQRLFSDRNRASRSGRDHNREASQSSTVQESQATGAQTFFAGFLAKAVATVCTFPVQKTQAMLQARPAQFNGSQLAAIKSIIFTGARNPGEVDASRPRGAFSVGNIFGLWRGLLPKLIQAALQQALIFRIKEILTKPTLIAVHRLYQRGPRDASKDEQ